MMQVSSFCRCGTIKTGAIIIGCIHAVFSLSIVILFASVFKAPYMVVMLTIPIIELILSILMIVGVKTKNLNFVFPFICKYCTNIMMIIPLIIMININSDATHHRTVWSYILSNFSLGITIALNIYFFMVIYTFYQKLLREKFAAPLTYQKTYDEIQNV